MGWAGFFLVGLVEGRRTKEIERNWEGIEKKNEKKKWGKKMEGKFGGEGGGSG